MLLRVLLFYARSDKISPKMNPVFQHFDIPKANKLQQQLIIRITMNVRTETNLRQDFQKNKVGMQVFRITEMLKRDIPSCFARLYWQFPLLNTLVTSNKCRFKYENVAN